MTLWMMGMHEVLVWSDKAEQLFLNPRYYPYFFALLAFTYLFFAVWLFLNRTGKNTILRNLHAGVVLSFIHPFVLAFAESLIKYNEISFLGVSVKYMVLLMFLSIPVAALSYLFYQNGREEVVDSREDILDDFE